MGNRGLIVVMLVALTCASPLTACTGATTGVGGERLNYLCAVEGSDSGAAVGLLGDLVPGQVWTANLAAVVIAKDGLTLQSSETVAISTVWQ